MDARKANDRIAAKAEQLRFVSASRCSASAVGPLAAPS